MPLCFIKGNEENDIDASMASSGALFSASEKEHVAACYKCLLKKFCPGPRKDYVSLYGSGEIKPCRNARYALAVGNKLENTGH